jgi:hypothetical protein
MRSTEVLPAFDAALQPIGYALAAELLAGPASLPVRPAHPSGSPAVLDLFGWELAAADWCSVIDDQRPLALAVGMTAAPTGLVGTVPV